MKKEKINYREHEEEFPDMSDVASANECTGLMYRTPVNEEEWESYQELSPMEIPRTHEMKGTLADRLHREGDSDKEAGESNKRAHGGPMSS